MKGQGGRSKTDFDARVSLIEVLIQVGFDDSIVIETQAFAERVLGDLKPSIDIATQGRGEEEPDGESQRPRLEPMHQRCAGRRLGQRDPELPSHLGLVGSSGGGEEPTPIHGGILMIDARRDGQRNQQELRSDRWCRKLVLKDRVPLGRLQLRQDRGAIKGQ